MVMRVVRARSTARVILELFEEVSDLLKLEVKFGLLLLGSDE